MNTFPDFNEQGELPPGIYQGTLQEVIERFGKETPRRVLMSQRVERIYALAVKTGHVRRFILFGSFVTAKPDPGDVDIFLLMEDTFDVSHVSGEAAILFNHLNAQNYEGASIFWIRRLAALEGEDAAISHWQIKRDGTTRGIIEVIPS